MSSLLDLLTNQLGGNAVEQIAGRIGADQNTTSKALSTALPLLLTALSRNAANPQGAQSLHTALAKDHSGGILDDVMGFVGGATSSANGAGILKHVLGGQRPTVEQGIAQASGLNSNSVGQLLELAAPLLMGALGRTTQQEGLDANGLAQFLGGQQQAVQSQTPDLLGMLGGLIDQNRDGNVLDDVTHIASKFFGGKQ
ncbi:MAG: DUF937 domain-containing protein [Ignavibacteriae bacterium]|nr:DUF937 domain-containing protein [Ignavibacteriota bacterium]